MMMFPRHPVAKPIGSKCRGCDAESMAMGSGWCGSVRQGCRMVGNRDWTLVETAYTDRSWLIRPPLSRRI